MTKRLPMATVLCAQFGGDVWNLAAWIKSPIYTRRRATLVNRYFAVHPDDGGGYTLRHRPTTVAAAHALTRESAIRLARRLTTKYGKSWDFTDPFVAKDKQFSDVVRLIREAKGTP